jgi:hypothetical protein
LPLDTSGVSLSLRVWCRSETAAPDVAAAIVEEVKAKASAAHIDILVPRTATEVPQKA